MWAQTFGQFVKQLFNSVYLENTFRDCISIADSRYFHQIDKYKKVYNNLKKSAYKEIDIQGNHSNMAILDYSDSIWREALQIERGSEPDVLILEGTWWRENATTSRLEKLSDVREFGFPEMYVGNWNGVRVAYCCAYGAARAVEPAHIFAQLGTPLLIQIGTCGTLDVNTGTGVVILPEVCAARDGISQIYGAGPEVETDTRWVQSAESILTKMGIETQRGKNLTWPSLFAQTDQMCTDWAAEGLLSIDMETSTVVAVADYFGVSAISMLTVWDALPHGRTFLDPLDAEDAKSLARSNEAVYLAALSLAAEVAAGRKA